MFTIDMRTLSLILSMLICLVARAGSASLSCPSSQYVAIADADGYDALYVVNSLDGVSLTYHSANGTGVTCVAYTDNGEAYGNNVSLTHSGTDWTVRTLDNQTSYLFMEGAQSLRVRVIDYTLYTFNPSNFNAYEIDGDCGNLHLACRGADEIPYYSPVGLKRSVSRDLKVTYEVLESNDEEGRLEESVKEVTLSHIPASSVTVDSPFQQTTITLSGDRFITHFTGKPLEVQTTFSQPRSVIAATHAECRNSVSDNVKGGAESTPGHFGGSGPVDMEFSADVSAAADFIQWQVSQSSDFSTMLYTYPYASFSDTFVNPGTTFVRFYASDTSSGCEYIGETYIVDVGESALECPNAFSPNDDGVNDLWKVSYRSLIDFDCHIFNRWGQEMCHLKNPSDGWDGKYGGKPVPAGVYYYVITATGSDGKKYKLSGDINIVNYR